MRTVVWVAVSPTAYDATVSAPNQGSRVSLTAFLRDTKFLSARLQICNYGASLYTNCSPTVKLRTVPNSICCSNGIVQHADPSLEEKIPLREQRMTHKILRTCHCPLHLLMTDCNPLRDTVKTGCNSEGPFTSNAVN